MSRLAGMVYRSDVLIGLVLLGWFVALVLAAKHGGGQ